MAERPHPTDVLVNDFARILEQSTRRLEAIVTDGLRRGLDPERILTPEQQAGDATVAYRRRSLQQAQGILANLDRTVERVGPIMTTRAYRAGAFAVDRTVTQAARLRGTFGGIHVGAVEALAAGMTDSLRAAVGRTGQNVVEVFARADAIEGGLSPRQGLNFIGRRLDDPYRRLALEELATGLVAGDTRRQITAQLVDRLVREGATDAITGFVDRAGRRIPLNVYGAMVARTTTREAVSRATVNRLDEAGVDLVTITAHPHKADVCSPYDGKTFSLGGRDGRYPELDRLPPYHPNCRHVVTPALTPLEDFEAALTGEIQTPTPATKPAAKPAGPAINRTPAPSIVRDVTGPPPFPADAAPPFPSRPKPRRTPDTADRQAAETLGTVRDNAPRYPGDPGPDPDELAAWERYVKKQDLNNRKLAKLELGDDLYKYVDRKWGRDDRLIPRFLEGELTRDDLEEAAQDHYNAAEVRRELRAERKRLEGFESKSIPCFSCGHFKKRPSSVCNYCGDDPVPLNTNPSEFDQFYGYSGVDAEGGYRSGHGGGKRYDHRNLGR